MGSIPTGPTNLGSEVTTRKVVIRVMHQEVYSEDVKTCSRCKLTLELRCFNRRSGGKPTSYCKQCVNEYCREHYGSNASKHNARRYKKIRVDRDAMRQLLIKAKSVPCAKCGKSYPSCAMDFDHRDPSTKEFNVAEIAAAHSIQHFIDEIEKCDVLCAICHRLKTHLNEV